ncbi:ectoine hydroxylase [Pseudonocardiaceae bacterium YIM PH 21723]|nr:ectoine hydroxylase [Pseudonocardiaceae bacterium YIM PH 21723]
MTATLPNAQDLYPSRLAAPGELLERQDPTVWPGVDDGPLGQQELQDYDGKGYLVVPQMITPTELESFRTELDRLRSDGSLKQDERYVVERETGDVRSIFAVHQISQKINDLVHDPRIVNRARQILGSDVYVHQSRVNYMPGFTGSGFYWHSDFETWHAEDGMPRMRACSFSIALTDNFAFNGGLMLMPGAHRYFAPCAGETPDENYKSSLQKQEIGVPHREQITQLARKFGIDQFTGPAGSALIFDSNSMHGSGNNITPLPRSNIFIVFNSVENTLGEPFAAANPRPRHIADREFTVVNPK